MFFSFCDVAPVSPVADFWSDYGVIISSLVIILVIVGAAVLVRRAIDKKNKKDGK